MSDNDRADVIRRAKAAGEAMTTGRIDASDVGPEVVILAHDEDRGVVIDLGDMAVAYLAPYNEATGYVTFTVPTGEAGS